MQQMRLALFYNLQDIIRKSDFHHKYDLLFQSLDLSGDREVEQTTHYKMRAIRNQMTIAHLSMSLIAYAAAILLDQPEKIRCFRTFALQDPLLALAG